MKFTHTQKSTANYIWTIVKVAVVVSMFFLFGWVAGLMSIVLVIDIN